MQKRDDESLSALAHRWVKYEESLPPRKNENDDRFLQWLDHPTMPKFIMSWWRGIIGFFRRGKK